MAAKSSAEQALHHGMIQDAIADIVTIIYRGGVQKESARLIVTEFATKAMKCALVQPVRPPRLEAKDWKRQWAQKALGYSSYLEEMTRR